MLLLARAGTSPRGVCAWSRRELGTVTGPWEWCILLGFQAVTLSVIRKCHGALHTTNDDDGNNGFMSLRKANTCRNKLSFSNMLRKLDT